MAKKTEINTGKKLLLEKILSTKSYPTKSSSQDEEKEVALYKALKQNQTEKK